MPISLQDKPLPSLKLPDIGDTVVVAIAHQSKVPLFEYRTDGVKKRAVTQDGKERDQLKLNVVVVSGKAVAGENQEKVAVGEEAIIYLSGHNWWGFIEATNKLGGLDVGDVMQWKFEGEEPGRGREPKKIRSSTIRHAKPEEADVVAKCEDIYRRLTATPLASVGSGALSELDEEDPF